MAHKTHPPGVIGADWSRMTGASRNAPPVKTPQQRRKQLVHHDAAIVATENIRQDEHLQNVRNTDSSKNTKQRAIGCESLQFCVD
jgi:hypothetical protein